MSTLSEAGVDSAQTARDRFDTTGHSRFGASSWSWELLALLVFAVVVSFVTYHHELWGDELQHWALARCTQTPMDVVRNLQYESTPPLWQLCLYAISRFTSDPAWMKVFHVVLAVISAAIVLFCAPFTRLQKLLCTFGYFGVYEYAVISRHYVMTQLFIFAFVALYPWRGKGRLIGASVCLFLVSQTSFYGLVLAFAGGATLFIHEYLRTDVDRIGRGWIAALVVVVLGLVLSFIQVLPDPDSLLHPAWDFINGWHALMASTTPWRVLVPVPLLRAEFWNTNVLDTFDHLYLARDVGSLLVQAVLSLGLMLASIALLRRRPDALMLLACTLVPLLMFTYLKKIGELRHSGTLYMAWLGAFWIFFRPATPGNAPRDWIFFKPLTSDDPEREWRRDRRANQLLTAVLSLQMLAGVYACAVEVRRPFAVNYALVCWLRENGLEDTALIAPHSISPLLDREDVVGASTGDHRLFRLFSHSEIRWTGQKLRETATNLEEETHTPCLVVWDENEGPLPPGMESSGFVQIHEEHGALVGGGPVVFALEDSLGQIRAIQESKKTGL